MKFVLYGKKLRKKNEKLEKKMKAKKKFHLKIIGYCVHVFELEQLVCMEFQDCVCRGCYDSFAFQQKNIPNS